jgi:hypothetical protein
MGHSRHFDRAPITSGLPRLADIFRDRRHVSNVPTAEIRSVCSPAAADPLQHLDPANAAGLMLVLASDIDEQLTVNARRSP